MRRELAQLAVILLLLPALLSNVSAGQTYNASAGMALSDAELQNWLVIETAAGMVFDDVASIKGYSTKEPIQLNWQLYDSRGMAMLNSSDAGLAVNTAGQHEVFTKVADQRWNWTINLQLAEFQTCLCIVELLAVGEDGSTARAATTMYNEQGDGSYPPLGILLSPSVDDIVADLISFTGYISDDEFINTGLMLEVMLCLQSECPLWQDWNNSGILLQQTRFVVTLNEWNDDDSFSASLSLDKPLLEDWQDGVWMGCLIPSDAAMNVGGPIWFRVSVNREVPIASLIGPSIVNETEVALIDGTGSLDPGWGWDGLQFVWSIHNIAEGSARAPYEWEWDMGAVLSLDTQNSGVYDIHLTVWDKGGKMNSTNHTLTVLNRAPISRVSLDDVALNEGELVRLPEATSWTFDSSASYDDELESGGLSRSWLLDGVTIGNTALLVLHSERIDGIHNLTLLMVDDDGSEDRFSISLVVAGSRYDPQNSQLGNDGMAWQMIATFVILGVVLIWGARMQLDKHRQKVEAQHLPSWKDKKDLDRDQIADQEADSASGDA